MMASWSLLMVSSTEQSSGTTTGASRSPWVATGTITMSPEAGYRIGPPAASAYAVLPVAVETMTASA